MRVLLILPVPPRTSWPKGLFRVWTFDTRLACAAAVLRRSGHEVRILQREAQLIQCGFDWEQADRELQSLIEEYRLDLVAQSVVTAAMPCGRSTRSVHPPSSCWTWLFTRGPIPGPYGT